MSNLLKVAGRTDNNTVRGVHVTEEGNVCTARAWGTDIHTIVTTELRDTSAVVTSDNVFDASPYGMISIRVANSHDTDVTLQLYQDTSATSGRWLIDAAGNPISVVVPAGDRCMIITPEDIPALNYLRYIKFRIAANTAPTSGSITIWVAGKR